MEMPSKDRALLRSVVIAAIAGSASTLLVAASCLGLAGPRRESTTTLTSASESITETVSSGDAAATLPEPAPAAQPAPADTSTMIAEAVAEALEAGARSLPPPAQRVSTAAAQPDAAPFTTAPPATTATPPAQEVPEAGASTVAQEEPRDAGAPDAPEPLVSKEWPYTFNRPPSPMLGAGDFSTSAPVWTSTSWVPNPQAGAGLFTTEWNIPAPNTPMFPMVGIPPRPMDMTQPAATTPPGTVTPPATTTTPATAFPPTPPINP